MGELLRNTRHEATPLAMTIGIDCHDSAMQILAMTRLWQIATKSEFSRNDGVLRRFYAKTQNLPYVKGL